MGYLTTIVIHNDALHEFEKDPKKFGEAVFECIRKANRSGKMEDIGFNGYCNYISAHPSRHADDETVYLHSGNTSFNLNPWNNDFKNLIKDNPNLLKSLIKRARDILKCAKGEFDKVTAQDGE